MTTETFFDLARQFADLGDSIGKQLQTADAMVCHGFTNPVASGDLNPNAMLHERTQRLLVGLMAEEVDGAEELVQALEAELGQEVKA